jgi:hypothetical protein
MPQDDRQNVEDIYRQTWDKYRDILPCVDQKKREAIHCEKPENNIADIHLATPEKISKIFIV